MTAMQQLAIELIQQLPDEKIKAIVTLAADEVNLIELKKKEQQFIKENAFSALEKLDLGLPEDFDADLALKSALEEKYDSAD